MIPSTIAMASLFALYLPTWAKCRPPQFGHCGWLCMQALPPVHPYVTTLHVCRKVRYSPAHIAHFGARSRHRKSVCPHLLQMPRSASACSGIKLSTLNFVPLTQISSSSLLPASVLGSLEITDTLPAGSRFFPPDIFYHPLWPHPCDGKGGICTPSFHQQKMES